MWVFIGPVVRCAVVIVLLTFLS
uniref:Uncharacterized protein n=1 Tax=Anguilla anguilla TaxID=7936 RepID=A0A0E9VGE1_ANGAN